MMQKWLDTSHPVQIGEWGLSRTVYYTNRQTLNSILSDVFIFTSIILTIPLIMVVCICLLIKDIISGNW